MSSGKFENRPKICLTSVFVFGVFTTLWRSERATDICWSHTTWSSNAWFPASRNATQRRPLRDFHAMTKSLRQNLTQRNARPLADRCGVADQLGTVAIFLRTTRSHASLWLADGQGSQAANYSCARSGVQNVNKLVRQLFSSPIKVNYDGMH